MYDLIFGEVSAPAPDDAWYDSALEWLGNVGEILTAVVAAVALLGLAWGLYRRTLGRRRDRYSRLTRLGANAQISFFSSVLGDPPAMRRKAESAVAQYDEAGTPYLEPKLWIECIWIDRDFYVHAVADEDETIHAYSVTTRSRRFRPTFRRPGGTWIERGWLARLLRLPDVKRNPKVRLGKTRFHELGRPEQAGAWMGAHNAHYFESYWGANPGLYQWFVYSINDAGYGAWDAGWDYERMHTFSWGFVDDQPIDPQLALVQAALRADYAEAQAQGFESEPNVVTQPEAESFQLEDYADAPLPSFYETFRRRARINTYTVLGNELALDNYPFYTPPPEGYPTIFGPSSVRTRTLAGEQS